MRKTSGQAVASIAAAARPSIAAGSAARLTGALAVTLGLAAACTQAVERLTAEEDVEEVQELLRRHFRYTQSAVADRVLTKWDAMQGKFAKIVPRDYTRAMAAMKRAEAEGIPWEQAVMEGAHG